jgi:uncharacterized protein DUF6544
MQEHCLACGAICAHQISGLTMLAKFMKEVAALGLPQGPGPDSLVTDADLVGLPDTVRRYLRFMGVLGRPRDWSFRLALTGRFRRSPDHAWMKCEAWQYNTRLAVARIFHMRARINGLVPVVARDTYIHGQGRMLVKLLDLFTVADGSGEEFGIGELVTYLNDGIMIAPSMLLVPEVIWSNVDASSFDVALTDLGRTVAARVFIDDRGAPTAFSTTDRFAADPKNPRKVVRARWTTPVEGWQTTDGRRLWTRGRAVWNMHEGDFVYADFMPVLDTLAFNLPPA